MKPGSLGDALLKRRFSLVDVAVTVLIVTCLVGVLFLVRALEFRSQLSAAAFLSPLPPVKAASEQVIPDSRAYRRPYQFTSNWFTANIPVWEKVLAPFRGEPGVQYLEIGLFEGRSAIWVLENILTHPSSRLTGIDVFQGPYKDLYFSNIERSGAADRVRTIVARSQLALRELKPDSFDINYVDGSHEPGDVLEDAVLSWRLLKPGGVLIFDDYRWAGCMESGTTDQPTDFPKTAIDPFIQCFRDRLDVIHNSYQLILKKKRDR
jgi:predicted O-methyltransferase YrrM